MGTHNPHHHNSSSHHPDNSKNAFQKFWVGFKRNYMKFIPIIGIIVLIFLFQASQVSKTSDEPVPFKDKLVQILNDVGNSIIIGDFVFWFTTLILLIVIWTGYKYWLLKIKAVRYNKKVVERIVVISMIVIVLGKHLRLNSLLGKIGDWIIFLLLLYLVVVGSWALAKIIDRINLASDLYCWGLRLLGGLLFIFGVVVFASSSVTLVFSEVSAVSGNILWILGICMMLLGVFMEFRSFRRYPMIKIW